MAKDTYIKPELAGGFRDYLPEDMIPRQKMLETIKEVFELFGFVPLDTPGMEKEEVLTGGDADFKKQLFRAGLARQDDSAGVEGSKDALAMRFDLTVPLARIIAANPDIKMPFKRYQFGRVWRGERQQAGRFREFSQVDADIVGSTSTAADAEIIALMYETMTALKVPGFMIRVNNRKILNGLASYAGFGEEKTPDVLRVLDKLDKQGWEENFNELVAKNALGLSPAQAGALHKFLELSRSGHSDALLAEAKKTMAGSEVALQGVHELWEIRDRLSAFGVPETAWRIDFSVARGLGYYTGAVFETILTKFPALGSVFSGGRYDGLVSRFSSRTVPAVGASVGIDRLFVGMEKLGLVKKEKNTAQALVLNFDSSAELQCAKLATELRQAGISTNLYLGAENTLKGQLAYAVSEEYPIVIIVGGDEAKRGVVQVKNMKERTQTEVKQANIVSEVKKVVKSIT